LFDIRKPLLPRELYEPIKCKQAGKFVVAPIICVHDLDKDIWVSAFIWNNGSFEQTNIGKKKKNMILRVVFSKIRIGHFSKSSWTKLS
jgi:hypothetical protein